ncbi:phosphatidate cytidylyltransferase [Verrucomicrobiota bacterium]
MAYDKKRILIGITVAAILISLMCLIPAGNPITLALFLAVAGLGSNEFYNIIERDGLPSSRRWGIAHGLIFTAATWLTLRYNEEAADTVLWSLLTLTLFSIFFRHLTIKDCNLALKTMTGTLFGFLYVPFLWSFMVRVFMSGNLSEPGWPGFFLLLMVKGCDTGAYFIGSKFGKTKLAPELSPKKSWEGLGGAVLAALVIGLLWVHFTDGKLGPQSISYLHAIILAILIPLIGTAGDLVESLLKRAVDVKDSGVMAHGLGGILDMIDSLLFAAPFLYIYQHFFLT